MNSRQKQKLLSGPEKIVKSAYIRSLAAKLKELPQVQAKLGKGAISDNKLYAMIAENEEKNNRVFYDNWLSMTSKNNNLDAYNGESKPTKRYESEFSYHPLLPNTNAKAYISPEFQTEFKEFTENNTVKKHISKKLDIGSESTMSKVKKTNIDNVAFRRESAAVDIRSNQIKSINLQKTNSSELSCSIPQVIK